MLPLTELGLDSHAARQAPDMPPRAYSQVDNEGVKALVDAICMRMRMRGGEDGVPFGAGVSGLRRARWREKGGGGPWGLCVVCFSFTAEGEGEGE
jgi:hypothetical protein